MNAGVLRILEIIDAAIVAVIRYFCTAMLFLMVFFITYTVVMRYVFLDPPFWGDTLAIFANIWFVMLAFVLAVHDREHIAMQALYDVLSPAWGFAFRLFWDLVIVVIGLFLLVYGIEAVQRVPGRYWELDGLRKSYPMMIMPITGGLVALAALRPIILDIRRFLREGRAVQSEGGMSGMLGERVEVNPNADSER